MATADHIGHGRFGVNLVPGSNAAEFRMFGQEIDEHVDTGTERPGHPLLMNVGEAPP